MRIRAKYCLHMVQFIQTAFPSARPHSTFEEGDELSPAEPLPSNKMLRRQAESSPERALSLSLPIALQWPLAQTDALERTTLTTRKLQGKSFAKITTRSKLLLLFLNRGHSAHSSVLSATQSIFTNTLSFLFSPWLSSVLSRMTNYLTIYGSWVYLILPDFQMFAEKNCSPSALLWLQTLRSPPPPYNMQGSKSSFNLSFTVWRVLCSTYPLFPPPW